MILRPISIDFERYYIKFSVFTSINFFQYRVQRPCLGPSAHPYITY